MKLQEAVILSNSVSSQKRAKTATLKRKKNYKKIENRINASNTIKGKRRKSKSSIANRDFDVSSKIELRINRRIQNASSGASSLEGEKGTRIL
jgi:hypothetical protein